MKKSKAAQASRDRSPMSTNLNLKRDCGATFPPPLDRKASSPSAITLACHWPRKRQLNLSLCNHLTSGKGG
jgi:hypothetical protein